MTASPCVRSEGEQAAKDKESDTAAAAVSSEHGIIKSALIRLYLMAQVFNSRKVFWWRHPQNRSIRLQEAFIRLDYSYGSV